MLRHRDLLTVSAAAALALSAAAQTPTIEVAFTVVMADGVETKHVYRRELALD